MMTLIAAVRSGNEGCIISDFRLTDSSTGNQFDVAQKYAFVGNKIALFMAGTVFYLTDITHKLNVIISKITLENFDDDKGPFIQEVISVFNSKPTGSSAIICVFLDENKKTFKMLRMDAIHNDGQWQYRMVPDHDFNWQVIGTGGIVAHPSFYPGRSVFSLQDIFKSVRDKGYDLFSAGYSIENEIDVRLKVLGKEVYKQLGISPIMNLTLITESGLQVVGRTVEGESYGNGINQQWSYSYARQQNGNVELKDEKTGQVVAVYQTLTDQFPDIAIGAPIQFDPAQLEGISYQYPKYTLSQWDVTLPGDNTRLVRYIHQTVYREWNGCYFPVRSIVHTEEKSFEQKIPLQPTINDYKIESNSLGDFKNIRLFNEDWLRSNLGDDYPFKITNS